MNDYLIVKVFTRSYESHSYKLDVLSWVEEHLGKMKFNDYSSLATHLNKDASGKPQDQSKFSRMIKEFKADTELKLSGCSSMTYWKGNGWAVYSILAKGGTFIITKLDDIACAVQLKLSI